MPFSSLFEIFSILMPPPSMLLLRTISEPSSSHLRGYKLGLCYVYATPMLRYSLDIPTIALHYPHDSLRPPSMSLPCPFHLPCYPLATPLTYRSSLLTLGKVEASFALLSLNRSLATKYHECGMTNAMKRRLWYPQNHRTFAVDYLSFLNRQNYGKDLCKWRRAGSESAAQRK